MKSSFDVLNTQLSWYGPFMPPWDQTSLNKLDSWGMQGFKVASADF